MLNQRSESQTHASPPKFLLAPNTAPALKAHLQFSEGGLAPALAESLAPEHFEIE